ncbi:MAG: PAS domain S-box protein, partial [Candidatus Sericytochromatia bacterium]
MNHDPVSSSADAVPARAPEPGAGLRVTVRHLERILNTIADPVFVKDESHRWVYLNEAFCALMGLGRASLIGQSDTDFFPPEEAAVFWAKDAEVLEKGGENVNEEAFTDAAGVSHVIVTKKSLYVDDEGRRFIVGVIREITEQKRIEEALRESESRYRGLVDATFDGIAIHENGAIIEANSALAAMSGYSLEEMRGLNGFDLVAPEYHEALVARFRSGDERLFEAEAIRKDGTRFSVEMVGKEAQYEGRPVRVAAFRDISARKRMEQALRVQNERLQELDLLKSAFVGSVSHELRTPLTSIKGYAEFLEDGIGGELTPTQLGFVHQIMEGSDRLERLVDDLLDFARLESGSFKLVVQEADLGAKIAEIVEAFGPQAKARAVTLVVSTPPAALRVPMDAGRVGQVISNLIGNAL